MNKKEQIKFIRTQLKEVQTSKEILKQSLQGFLSQENILLMELDKLIPNVKKQYTKKSAMTTKEKMELMASLTSTNKKSHNNAVASNQINN